MELPTVTILDPSAAWNVRRWWRGLSPTEYHRENSPGSEKGAREERYNDTIIGDALVFDGITG
jgi:hypothetical protein